MMTTVTIHCPRCGEPDFAVLVTSREPLEYKTQVCGECALDNQTLVEARERRFPADLAILQDLETEIAIALAESDAVRAEQAGHPLLPPLAISDSGKKLDRLFPASITIDIPMSKMKNPTYLSEQITGLLGTLGITVVEIRSLSLTPDPFTNPPKGAY